MKRKIVETLSMEEAFRVLNNRKSEKITIKEGWEAEAPEYYSGDELRQAVAEEMEFMLDQLGENVTLDAAYEYFMELCAEARITFDRKELEAILRDEYGITEGLKESASSDYDTNSQLESIDVVIDDYSNITSRDLANYAANPTIRKYAQKNIFDKIATSDAILEMTSDDFGDGHGDPKGYIFAKDGNVSYIVLSSNAYDYTPNISFNDFKNIIEGKDLFWNEIGFGDFSDADHYIFDPINSVEDIIKECDEHSEVYLWNLENLVDYNESLNESTAAPVIPAPYDKYFEVIDPNEIEFEDGMIEIGEEVDGATVLAYLAAKDEYFEYFDSDAFLIDDEACPVVEIAHDRCYPIDVEEIFGESFLDEDADSSAKDKFDNPIAYNKYLVLEVAGSKYSNADSESKVDEATHAVWVQLKSCAAYRIIDYLASRLELPKGDFEFDANTSKEDLDKKIAEMFDAYHSSNRNECSVISIYDASTNRYVAGNKADFDLVKDYLWERLENDEIESFSNMFMQSWKSLLHYKPFTIVCSYRIPKTDRCYNMKSFELFKEAKNYLVGLS